MRPFIERIDKNISPSWRFIDYYCDSNTRSQCDWHFHNEFELVLYHDPHGVYCGTVVAGDFVGASEHQAAFFYGPGLPHMISGVAHASPEQPCSSHVLWIDPAWLARIVDTEPALSVLKPIIEKASRGIRFSLAATEKLYALINGAENLKPARQFARIIEILLLLADDQQTAALTANPCCFVVEEGSSHNMVRVKNAQHFIETNYHEKLMIEDLCHHLHISESSLYRLFEKHFSASFADYVKQYRIGKACELLVRSKLPVSVVAERVGFSNLSNFNRQFKAGKNMTPSAFRALFE